MTGYQPAQENAAPRPVFFGCFGMVAGAITLALLGFVFVRFLESGADDGKVTLRVPESYARGAAEYSGDGNFFLVRFEDGEFAALDDLDAANQHAEGSRCRVQPLVEGDRLFNRYHSDFGSSRSARARATNIYLREACSGAIYDFAGMRLDSDGRNLDRFRITINEAGQLVIDTRSRTCTEHAGSRQFLQLECP